MPNTLEVLARFKETTRRRFLSFVGRTPVVSPKLAIPTDATEALKLGIQIGRQEGYGEGLVEGTKLGLDVGYEVVDALMTQPVILDGTVGTA